MSISDGLGSRKLEVLADTTVMLEQGSEGVLASEIIKRMLKVVLLPHNSERHSVYGVHPSPPTHSHPHTHAHTPHTSTPTHTRVHTPTILTHTHLIKTVAHTSDRVTHSLEQHFLWSELTVLARFLLALSFNNKVNGSPLFYYTLIPSSSLCTLTPHSLTP